MKPTTKRGFLIALLSLTGLATLVTVLSIFGASDRHMGAVVGSMVGIGYLLVISLGAFSAFDRNGWNIPAFIGLAFASLMMILHPVYMWWMMSITYTRMGSSVDLEMMALLARLEGLGFSLAGLFCLVPFVMAARMKLAGMLVQIATTCGLVISFILIQIISWGGLEPSEEFMRTVFALLILTSGGLLTVAILNKFFGIKIKPMPVTYGATSIQLTCPRCFHQQSINVGDGACSFCKLKIKIDIEEPLCPTCGYNLHNLTRQVCPECGTSLGPAAPILSPEAALAALQSLPDAPNPDLPQVR